MKTGIRFVIPGMVVGLLLATAAGDHYFRDEFYYLACSRRMAWGYVDQPPLSIAVLWLLRHLAGESLFALRAVSALVLAFAVLVTGSLARRLGAGAFGEMLAMTCAAVAPTFLAVGSFYSMNVFDLLLWSLAARAFVDALDRPSNARWAILGVLLGFGLLNKISVLWLGGGMAAALLLTRARRLLLTPGPYIAAAIAGAVFVPHVLWQAANGWPTIEFIRNASRDKMQVNTPWSFLADQVRGMHPLTVPVWAGGLVALLVHPRLRRYRPLGVVFVTVAAILIANRTSRAEYLAPAYPIVFAAGGAFWEGLVGRRSVRAATIAVLAVTGAAIAPLAIPILSANAYARYSRALGDTPSTEERKEVGRLPQFFADRQGWEAFVAQVAAAWTALPEPDRARAAVLTGNYGEAGAIERLGAALGIVAISGHNTYWLWGPRGRTGDVLIVLTRDPRRLAQRFENVQRVGETDCGDCMPYENHVGIYLCRRMRVPLQELWPELKHYD